MSKRTVFSDWILFENEDLIVINKPSMVSSLDERNSPATSILEFAKQHHPDAQLCHRLDKETSGVMLIAKNPEAYREVSIMFEKRRIDKVYHAIVDGTVNFDETAINLPIRETKKATVVIDHSGKSATTIFKSLIYYRHFTLIECRPVTGRMHQIRIHLAAQQSSITGDTLYGGKIPYMSKFKKKFKLGKFEEEKPVFNRVALHARSITLEWKDEPYTFEAPYPHDLEVFIKLLGKYDGM
jgi:23S rRNA pseudouridine955/2504/2580 synthase